MLTFLLQIISKFVICDFEPFPTFPNALSCKYKSSAAKTKTREIWDLHDDILSLFFSYIKSVPHKTLRLLQQY